MTRQMAITTFMHALGYHRDSWRMPGSRAEEVPNLELIIELAKMGEAAKLDALFWGDSVHANAVARGDIHMNGLYEPLTVLSALASHTSQIGLIATLSTSLEQPYHVARRLQALDHLSKGRAGWNIVTSSDGYRNFGLPGMPDGESRYARAAEFVEVCRQLWDSWSDDAVLIDREGGRFLDTEKVRRIDFKGEIFDVEGPLTAMRSPQGHPVLVQAGSSPIGMAFGAANAELIYTAQANLELSVKFYSEVKALATAAGRNPDHVKVLPGIIPVIGDTDAEARELADHLADFLNLEFGRKAFGVDIGFDISDIGFDERIPAERFPDPSTYTSRQLVYRRMAVDEGLVLRDLLIARARSTGHQFMAGTASAIADRMQEWFEARACDGFNINAPFNPGGFRDFCTKLIPELQSRGLFRTEYEGSTLREHLGLPRPANVF